MVGAKFQKCLMIWLGMSQHFLKHQFIKSDKGETESKDELDIEGLTTGQATMTDLLDHVLDESVSRLKVLGMFTLQ